MDTELRCLACIDAVIANTKLLNGSRGWVLGADGKRHWTTPQGRAVCGLVEVLNAPANDHN